MEEEGRIGRARAPKRAGRRTQLTVPHDVWRSAEALAALSGTTPNDIVVRFAAEGINRATLAAARDRLAEERWQAVDKSWMQIEIAPEDWPSEEEMLEWFYETRRLLDED